jgi:hypothetical protein
MKRPGLFTERAIAKMLWETNVPTACSETPLRNEKMNDYVSLLLQGYAAKRKLTELFQCEGGKQANHPSTAIATRDGIPAIQTAIGRNSKAFRENCRKQGLVRKRTPTVLRASQRDQIKRDLTVSGFVFTLVLVGVILAAHTDRPVFWLLIGPLPVAVLHTIRTFLGQLLRRQEGLLAFYKWDR